MESYHRTGYPSANTWPPCSIDFISRGARCQTSHKEYHKAKSCHGSTNYNEYHLDSLNPEQTEMEHLIEHDDG